MDVGLIHVNDLDLLLIFHLLINSRCMPVCILIGLMRLIRYLSQDHLFGEKQLVNIVVDAGTGTTAIGLALGALLFG